MKNIEMRKFEVPIPSADGESITETIIVEVPVAWNEELKQYLITPDAQKIIEDTKARHMGLLLPDQLRELRVRLGDLTQTQIGELLQIGEKSWSRWESGKQRPSRSVNLLLRALYDGQIGVEYLERVGRTGSKWGKIIDYSEYHQSAKRSFIRMDEAVSYHWEKAEEGISSGVVQRLALAS
jgi:DNA-binding transcriptional regulator YiaG